MTKDREEVERNANTGCKVEGCNGKHQARGYCNKHYQKLLRHGDPLASGNPGRPSVNVGKTCSLQDCENPAYVRGYCRNHYRKFLEHGDPLYRSERARGAKGQGTLCAYEGCGRVTKSRGFCSGHYIVVRTSAEREHLLPEEHRAERCLAPECPNPQYADGLCKNHYEIRRREGEAWTARYEVTIPHADTLGGRVRLERIRRGWTEQDLADKLNVSRQRVNQVEKQSNMQVHTIKQWASALEVPVDYLIDKDGLDDPGAVEALQKRKRKPGRPKTSELSARLERLEVKLEKVANQEPGIGSE